MIFPDQFGKSNHQQSRSMNTLVGLGDLGLNDNNGNSGNNKKNKSNNNKNNTNNKNNNNQNNNENDFKQQAQAGVQYQALQQGDGRGRVKIEGKQRAKSVINRTYSSPSSYFTNDQSVIMRPGKHVIASQTHSGAPLKLTSDFRTHEAKLFGSKGKIKASHGPVIGASPAVMSRRKGTKILDESAKIQRSQSTYNNVGMYGGNRGRSYSDSDSNSNDNNNPYARPIGRMLSSPVGGYSGGGRHTFGGL